MQRACNATTSAQRAPPLNARPHGAALRPHQRHMRFGGNADNLSPSSSSASVEFLSYPVEASALLLMPLPHPALSASESATSPGAAARHRRITAAAIHAPPSSCLNLPRHRFRVVRRPILAAAPRYRCAWACGSKPAPATAQQQDSARLKQAISASGGRRRRKQRDMALFSYLQMAIMQPLDLIMRGRVRQRYYTGSALADASISNEDDTQGVAGEVEVKPVGDGTGEGSPADKRHLIILVNGLFGSADNWAVVVECLQARLGKDARRETLVAASKASSRRQTYDGIDACSRRLAAEIHALKAAHPNLTDISFVGHSMGGLICRHAVGILYEEGPGTVAGLRPRHFLTMATPHLGCDTMPGPAQVPFMSWLGRLPRIQGVVVAAAPAVSPLLFGRAGRQFFLQDEPDDGEAEPIIVRMSRDVEGEGAFMSGLGAFRSRTAYANAAGDHLVGWANASLRRLESLPLLPEEPALGVVREDPLPAGMAPAVRAALNSAVLARLQTGTNGVSSSPPAGGSESPRAAFPSGSRTSGLVQTASLGDGRISSGPSGLAVAAAAPAILAATAERQASDSSSGGRDAERVRSGCLSLSRADSAASSTRRRRVFATEAPALQNGDSAAAAASAEAMQGSPEVDGMLQRLKSLPWRRVDVSFSGAKMPYTAHNLIQVTRRWINFEGVAVARHLAEQLAALDDLDRASAVKER